MENKRQASRRKFHFIYKPTCLINEKYYYGMHSTDNLEDGYIGSGKYLWHSINKHGRENFKMEILEQFSSRERLKLREKDLITEDMLKNPMCMNLKLGGEGGWDNALAKNRPDRVKGAINANRSEKKTKNPEYIQKRSDIAKKLHETGKMKTPSWFGKIHNQETKNKMSLSKKTTSAGERNSQFGKCWIFNNDLKISKSVKLDECEKFLNDGWIKGRKLVFR